MRIVLCRGADYTVHSASIAVAQPRREAVDRQVDRALRAQIGLARAVAAQELDLQVIERIEIRKAVANAARKRRVLFEQRLLSGDREIVRARARVLGDDAREYAITQRRIG